MTHTVAVGAQWGDEGKGKIVDLLAAEADVIARFQGGPNAGHTLVVGGDKTVLNHIPSGILHAGKLCLIGNGALIDPLRIDDEMRALEAAGVPLDERLRIGDRCHLILPYHRALDAARERGDRRIGTTGRGIGPAYEDKAARRGVRLCDLDAPDLEARIAERIEFANFLLTRRHRVAPVAADAVWRAIDRARMRLLPLVVDVSRLLEARIEAGDTVLFEGAQGVMLDLDHGTYPFVTSSNTVAGAATIGLGVGPQAIGRVLGICKAYTTRVGEGPFPTELYDAAGKDDPIGRLLAERGDEFGATTGRPRRTGWFDAVVVRHAVRVCGLTGLALTKLDVLDGLDAVRICVGYQLDGERLDAPPPRADQLARCIPIYETLPGWTRSTRGARRLSDLPREARAFLDRIAERCGAPIEIVSTGPDRGDAILC